MHKLMPPRSPALYILGRHSLVRHLLVRGVVLLGAAALLARLAGADAPGVRPVLAVAASGLSTLSGRPVQLAGVGPAAPSAAAIAAAGHAACASGPHAKWSSAPPAASAERPYRPPEPLVVRSDLTGEPYAAPDKPPLDPVVYTRPTGRAVRWIIGRSPDR